MHYVDFVVSETVGQRDRENRQEFEKAEMKRLYVAQWSEVS